MICLNKDNEKYPYTSKLSKQKNAPNRGKFFGRLIMREIGSIADDLDVGTVHEGVFMHIAPLRDAYFGEAGARKYQSSGISFACSSDSSISQQYYQGETSPTMKSSK